MYQTLNQIREAQYISIYFHFTKTTACQLIKAYQGAGMEFEFNYATSTNDEVEHLNIQPG